MNQITKYSASSMKTYSQCNRKFYYTYIKKLPRQPWDHFDLGTLCHYALEFFYRNYKEGEDPAEIMGESFKRARQQLGKVKTPIIKEAKQLLQDYVYKIKEEGIPKIDRSLEKKFKFTLDGKYVLNGIIDRLDQDENGNYFIYDYKTSKSIKYMDDFQLAVYALWFFDEHKDIDEVNAGYIMLRHDSRILKYKFTRESIESRKREILNYCESILAEKEWGKNPGPLCRYCDFYTDVGGPCTGNKKEIEWTVTL